MRRSYDNNLAIGLNKMDDNALNFPVDFSDKTLRDMNYSL